MFTICEKSCSESMMIKHVVGTVDENNMITITWDWPRDGRYNLCFIYAIEEDESLEDLLRRDAPKTIYEDEFGVRHKTEIQSLKVRFKLFPAIKINPNEIQIVDQITDNISQVFYKRINLEYHIEYKTSLLSQIKRAQLAIRGLNGMGDDFLQYRCIGGGKDNTLYPIDLKKFQNQSEFTIFLNKREEIQIVLTESQREYINLNYR
jgi:hypothetical protein